MSSRFKYFRYLNWIHIIVHSFSFSKRNLKKPESLRIAAFIFVYLTSFYSYHVSKLGTLIKANPYLKETGDITSDSIRRPTSMPNTMTNLTSNFNRANNNNNVTVATPVATPITATMPNPTGSAAQAQVPKTNIRFAYMNSNVNNNNTTVNSNQQQQKQRIWSAESSIGNGNSSQV